MTHSSILITGAGGQVGHELVRRAGGRAVLAFDRSGLDLTDAAAVASVLERHQPAVVINAAAYTAVDRAENEPELALACNRDGPAHLAAACQRHGAALLHISTDYVFDGSKDGAWTEDDAAAPLGVYGQSKWQGEQAVRAACARHLMLRVAWVFGAHGNNFVRTMLRLGAERDVLRVVADQRGGPTPAAAIADALLQLADRCLQGQELPWGTYHFVGEPATTWHGFAEAIFAQAVEQGLLARAPQVLPIATADYPTPARRPANSVLDTHRARTLLQLVMPDWREGLNEVLQEWNDVGKT